MSDIVHQSVYELVHSEDREELQRQLMWNSHLPSDKSNLSIPEIIQTENLQLLERSFSVRFRCLLDNTSGFLRLDIRGRIKVLHGQNKKTETPPLALFAVCSPFGPTSLLDMPQKDEIFTSKHKLDLSLITMDQKGKALLGYTNGEVTNKSVYDLVHYDDINYVAKAHQQILKTGGSDLLAYRLSCKDKNWQWLQTKTQIVYKNSKPDHISCTHRPLAFMTGLKLNISSSGMISHLSTFKFSSRINREEEGRDMLGKRTMDFKIGFLDAALNISERNSIISDSDLGIRPSNTTTTQTSRRYKSAPQIRDIITNCRSKRTKMNTDHHNHTHHYVEDNTATNYNSVYANYPTTGSTGTENGIPGSYVAAAAAFQPNFYPTIDNSRFLTTAENLIHYRHHLTSYYPDYTAHTSPYPGNSLLDVTSAAVTPRTCFSSPGYTDTVQMPKDERLYVPCQMEASKYNRNADCSTRLVQPVAGKAPCCDDYSNNIATAIDPSGREGFFSGNTINLQSMLPSFERDIKITDQSMCTSSLQLINDHNSLKPKSMDPLCPPVDNKIKNECHRESCEPSNSLLQPKNCNSDSRDSVLMWGNSLDRDDYLTVSCGKAIKVPDSINSPEIKTTPERTNGDCKWVVVNASSSSVCGEDNSSTPNSSSPPSTSTINVTSNGKMAFCTDSPIYSSTTISDISSEDASFCPWYFVAMK
ncbi:Aryl hydrocarbon receptor [Nymphon striatum]|nr:Aryl hydrocarbon receptor [Nymphon striatum]